MTSSTFSAVNGNFPDDVKEWSGPFLTPTNWAYFDVDVKTLTSTNVKTDFNVAVLGCPDPAPPRGGWVERSADGREAVAGCSDGDVTQRLTCTGTTWEGQLRNCSGAGAASGSWGPANIPMSECHFQHLPPPCKRRTFLSQN